MRLTPAMWRLLPPISIAVFALVVAAVLASAGRTLGFDFLAYHAAADRVLHGQPAYDTSFQGAGGFGLFYYPPTFIPLILPFGLLGATTATGCGSASRSPRSRSAWSCCRSRAARSG